MSDRVSGGLKKQVIEELAPNNVDSYLESRYVPHNQLYQFGIAGF